MATRSVATVFGGSGFIGRYVVKRLAASGYVVRVAVRDPEAALFLKPMGAVGQIAPLRASLPDRAAIERSVDGAELVVNLVGLLAERRAGDFDRVMGQGPGLIAAASAAGGVRRMVHVSAIGADPGSPSRYARAKAEGERGVLAAFPAAAILRPSVLFGPEDGFFNRFGMMAQLLPVMPVISGATRLQPVYVGDVADAVIAALARPEARGRTYELGGPDVWTLRQVQEYVLAQTRRHRRLLAVPGWLARLQAAVLERLPGRLLTRDQLLLLGRDSVVASGAAGLAELGIPATPIDLVVPGYLQTYRRAGAQRDGLAPI